MVIARYLTPFCVLIATTPVASAATSAVTKFSDDGKVVLIEGADQHSDIVCETITGSVMPSIRDGKTVLSVTVWSNDGERFTSLSSVVTDHLKSPDALPQYRVGCIEGVDGIGIHLDNSDSTLGFDFLHIADDFRVLTYQSSTAFPIDDAKP